MRMEQGKAEDTDLGETGGACWSIEGAWGVWRNGVRRECRNREEDLGVGIQAAQGEHREDAGNVNEMQLQVPGGGRVCEEVS